MKAKCRSRSGMKVELTVLDISPIGCMVDRAGIEFEELLHEAVFTRLKDALARGS